MKHLIFLHLLLLLLSHAANAKTFETLRDGKWNEQATWTAGKVPGLGDQAVINHKVVLVGKQAIGAGQPDKNGEPALKIAHGGRLIISPDSLLSCHGNLIIRGEVEVLQGSLEMKPSTTNPKEHLYISISPPYAKRASLAVVGTRERPARIVSTPSKRASIIDGHAWMRQKDGSSYLLPAKGGTLNARHAEFIGLGNEDSPAWQYSQFDGMDIKLSDVLFERCSRIEHRGIAKISFKMERCRWRNSVLLTKKQIGQGKALFTASAGPGSAAHILSCDFDERVSLSLCNGYTIEDSVFRGSVVRYSGKWHEGNLISFKRNLLRWSKRYSKGGLRLPYGESYEDCIFVHDYADHNNPHFMHVSGKSGIATLRGCLFWFSGPNTRTFGPEGDGPMVGDAIKGGKDENRLIIERCIFMPNSYGPDKKRNNTANVTSGLLSTTTSRVIVRRNTAFSGGGPGGVCIGETHPTKTGALLYVKSNLFVGSKAMDGQKIHDFGKGETNAIKAKNSDYNAGFRLAEGSNYIKGVTGKGYSALKLEGDKAIGRNDIDDVDPQFVDARRNPLTWSKSKGGAGTMIDAMDRLSPTGASSIADLLEYLREGFRPTNPVLRAAGDPDQGSPDIGAVDMAK